MSDEDVVNSEPDGAEEYEGGYSEDSLGETLGRLAAEQDILLDQDPAVTARLTQVPPAEDIPPLLLEAVAEVLGFLRDLDDEQDTKGGLRSR